MPTAQMTQVCNMTQLANTAKVATVSVVSWQSAKMPHSRYLFDTKYLFDSRIFGWLLSFLLTRFFTKGYLRTAQNLAKTQTPPLRYV